MDVQHRAAGSGTRKSATPRRDERRENVAPSDDHVIVLFGATGDLAKRKLLPGLFHLAKAGLLPARYRIIGSARHALTDDEFRRQAKDAVTEFGLAKPHVVGPDVGASPIQSPGRVAAPESADSFPARRRAAI